MGEWDVVRVGRCRYDVTKRKNLVSTVETTFEKSCDKELRLTPIYIFPKSTFTITPPLNRLTIIWLYESIWSLHDSIKYVSFVSSMGFCILTLYGVQLLYENMTKMRRILQVSGFMLLCFFCLKTITRNQDWLSRESLLKWVIHVVEACLRLSLMFHLFLRIDPGFAFYQTMPNFTITTPTFCATLQTSISPSIIIDVLWNFGPITRVLGTIWELWLRMT